MLGKSDRGILCLKRRESLDSCLFSTKPRSTRRTAVSHELTPLSLNCLTDRSRSKGRVESILCILDFTNIVFKAWCCLFNSSIESSPATKNILCVVIESTCDVVIAVEAANCYGASNHKSGMPSPLLAGDRVTSWRRSLGRSSVWPNSVGRLSRRSLLGLGQCYLQTTLLCAWNRKTWIYNPSWKQCRLHEAGSTKSTKWIVQ